MPAKKSDTTYLTTPRTSAASQLAELNEQIAALKATVKATRENETKRHAEERAQKKAAKTLTLEQVIEKQSHQRQKWIEETIAGRAIARISAGQDQNTAVSEVLATFAGWALEEIERRQTSKTQDADKSN